MRYALTYFFLLHFCFAKSQTRFNINIPVGIDTISDIGVKVIELQNGHILSCGNVLNALINYNASYLVKTNSLGNVIWKKQYDVSIGGSYDSFIDLVELPDSNYLVTGITTNTLTNDDDGFLAKIDTGGNIVWLQKYVHPDDDEITAMRLTPDGKVIILGYTFSSGTYSDVLLIKTDLNGNLIWRKRFGNTFDEMYRSIEIIKNNTEYLLGGDYGYYNTGNPYYDMSLMRTDTAGNIIWQQQYGISPNESGKCSIPTLDSGFAICGIYNDTGSVLKTDKNGVVQWIKKYSQEQGTIYSLKQLQDSSYVMIKSDNDWQNNNRTGYLVKADKNGNQLWQRVYPHPTSGISNYFFGFNTTADKGFIITGQYNHIGQPFKNMWLVKTDSLGCDSVTCSYLVTDIKDISYELGEMSLAPNPTNGLLTISSLHDFTKIEVLSITGQILLSETVDSKTHQLELQNFAEGIYFVRVSYADEQSVMKKVIVRH
ncbi:MAG: T9SS type A sorting domain-containing protein [Bacteroidetes bacterium]|nr:T9SS type A sorting domain-containing protein [Bacteroidota bacterium]